MARLIAKSASEGLVPLRIGALTLRDAQPARMTAVAPWPGKEKAAGQALRKLGLGWPDPGRAIQNGKASILWAARGQAFLVNAAPDGLDAVAALTDISDGWTVLTLMGRGAADVLARLVPLDLSRGAFPEGTTARTSLGHMQCLLYCNGPERFHLSVFRSMTQTAVHEIETAMKAMAARAAV